MQPLEGSECAGVDLNRNFDSHWDQVRVRVYIVELVELVAGSVDQSKLCI